MKHPFHQRRNARSIWALLARRKVNALARAAPFISKQVRVRAIAGGALAYCWRRAITGSTRLARRAGRKLASSAATTSVGTVISKVESQRAASLPPGVARCAPQLARQPFQEQRQ